MKSGAQFVDTIVVGAGISGLAAAHALQKRSRSCAVVEARPSPGGVIGSRARDGFLYETGPNSVLDTTPAVEALLQDLGIAGERVDASSVASTRFVVRNRQLVALPNSPRALLTTDAFTTAAKLRLLAEPFIARSAAGIDESIAGFVRRRLGAEFLDYAIDPFVAGIYAGDPERISVAAAFPRLLALEQRYGSLVAGAILGARARRKSGSTAKIAARSFSFRGGMQTLTDKLAEALSGCIAFGTSVTRIARDDGGGFIVESRRDERSLVHRARSVVLAVPAAPASALVEGIASDAAEALSGIEYAPIVVVISAYCRRDVQHSLAGFGFLVPNKERLGVLGSLFSSSMFDGRAPDGDVLITTFCGGRRDPAIVSAGDDRVAMTVRTELAMLLRVTAAPRWQAIVRWPRAIPQYEIGHLDRMRRLAAAESKLPGLYFCASYRGGVAVGDCIASAHAVAQQVDAYLSTNPAPAAATMHHSCAP